MLRWPDATVYQGIAEVASRTPGRPAVLFDGGETTYDELLKESRMLARGLAALGVSAGDRIAVWLGNRPEWIKAQLAASFLGAAIVAVNTRYRTHELEYMLDDSGCRVVLTERSFLGNEYLDMLATIVPALETSDPEAFAARDGSGPRTLEHVIALESSPDYPAVRSLAELDELGSEAPDGREPASDPGAPACVFYTSGTTSDPKGCLQSSRSLLNHSYNAANHLDVDTSTDDVALGVLPFCGVWGYNTFLGALAHGIPLVVQTHFEAAEMARLIDTHDVTYTTGLATMFHRMIESDGFDISQVDTLQRAVVGFLTMGYEDATFDRLEDVLSCRLVRPYGLSEGNSMVFVGDLADPKEQRTRRGGPLVHDDLDGRIVDPDTGEERDPGEQGELLLRGYNCMNGYLDKPAATAEAIDEDGWLHTDDLGTRDERGYLYFHARLDDAIRVRGFLVAPVEIESAIDQHPDVERSQVVGVTHPVHGQVPIAFVKLTPDADLTADDLRSFLEDHVADYKVPERIVFVEEFPRTEGPHGQKIQKHELRDRAESIDVSEGQG